MSSNELFRTVDSRYGRLTIFANDSGAVSESLTKYGEWAENELSFLHAMIEEGASVVDVGAYIGTHALAFSRFVGPSGQVVAIEPQTQTFDVLKQNISANGARNVRLEHAVASFEAGDATIPSIDIDHADSFGSASLREVLPALTNRPTPGFREPAANEISVHVTTIDDLGISKCALIKIDVEGAEDLVLRGARETIRRDAPIIYAECNSLEHGLKSVAALQASGYRVFAHVVSAYNPGNFLGNHENSFGAASEVALVGVAGPDIERIKRYAPRSCEMLLDIETADDLALALLNKPQYEPEVLRLGAAARTGADRYLDDVVGNRLEIERLNTEVAERRRLALERAEAFERTDAALTDAQQLAVERAQEIDRLNQALSETQELARERGRQVDRVQAALDETQRLAIQRAQEIQHLTEEYREELGRMEDKVQSCLMQSGIARHEANRLQREISQAQLDTDRLRQEADLLRATRDDLLLRATNAETALISLQRSSSWRYTAPVRKIAGLLRHAPGK
jgi:FkbM family methyltransferase